MIFFTSQVNLTVFFLQTDLNSDSFFAVNPYLTVGDLKGFYPDIRRLKFKCCPNPSQTPATSVMVSQTKSSEVINAFSVLMSGVKVYPSKKTAW
jgi:hypothetical protein